LESAAGRLLYRVVENDPPQRTDFVPQGQRPRYKLRRGMSPAEKQSAICGVSVFNSEALARHIGEWLQRSGKPVAGLFQVVIPDPTEIDCDDTVGMAGHWDLFGTTDDLLGCVAGILIPL
jgi:hypothetical protein